MSRQQHIETVERTALKARVALLSQEGWRLVQILFTPFPDAFELLYSFDKAYDLLSLRVSVPREDPVVPSITPSFFAAFTYENELQDLAGLKVAGLAPDFAGDFYKKTRPAPFAQPQNGGGRAAARAA